MCFSNVNEGGAIILGTGGIKETIFLFVRSALAGHYGLSPALVPYSVSITWMLDFGMTVWFSIHFQ